MAGKNPTFFGASVEQLENEGFVVQTQFTVENAEQALALTTALVAFASAWGTVPTAAKPADKPVAEAKPADKPVAEAKPAAKATKPPKAELPPEDDDEDELPEALAEALAEAETIKEVVSFFVDQKMKVGAVVKAINELKGRHPVVDRFDPAKLDARVKSLFEALAE